MSHFLTAPVVLPPEGTTYIAATNDAGTPLGQLAVTRDGRRFRWARARATSAFTQPGLPAECPLAPLAYFPWTVAPALTFGVSRYRLTGTLGAFTGAPYPVNSFAQLSGRVGAAGLRTHAIKTHTAIDTAAPPSIDLVLADDDGIAAGEVITGDVRLIPNPYSDLVPFGTDGGNMTPIGVFVMPVPPGWYGWLQVGGACPMIAAGAMATYGAAVKMEGGVGSVRVQLFVQSAGGNITVIGFNLDPGATANAQCLVNLALP